MKKISISLIVILISDYLIYGALPEAGVGGLFNGVNIRNSPLLFLSEFIIVSMILFNNLGKCENYLKGYGKYLLLRHKRRQLLLLNIFIRTLAYICFVILLRALVYILILKLKNERICFSMSMTINYEVLSVLTFTFLCSVQYYLELKYSALAGITVTMIYYLFTISIGGVLAEKEIYFPIIFLLPNYYMKNRSEVIITEMHINEWLLYLILLLSVTYFIVLCQNTIKKKDIF